jgi:hypothetical protein
VDEGYPERWVEALLQGPYPPYFDYPYCVHETFALEAAEALYRVALFRVTDVTQLEEFVRRDVFSTDCHPSDHIRCIEIEMSVPEGPSSRGPHKSQYAKSVDHLASLFKIKRPIGLRVRLVINCSRGSPPLPCFTQFEEVLAPTIHQLHHSGASVAWFRRNEDFEIPVVVEVPNLNRDYTVSMEEMIADIAANSAFVSDLCSISYTQY